MRIDVRFLSSRDVIHHLKHHSSAKKWELEVAATRAKDEGLHQGKPAAMIVRLHIDRMFLRQAEAKI